METLTLTRWTSTQKVLFRFLFCYLVFYFLSDGLLSMLIHSTPLAQPWDTLIFWVGENVLQIGYPIPTLPNGSGDTTYNYVQLFTIACLSVLITIAWSWFDREQPHYEKMLEGLRIVTRFYLGYIMIMYGLAKVFKTQFPYPNEAMLSRTYGESSPMGLLWTFMGLSYPYNLFTGMGEVVGGALLFFRKTTLLGALIIIGVMSNVVILNFSYDVPVKLYSSHLLLMAFFLASPDLRRLYKFFVTNEQVAPARERTLGLNKTYTLIGQLLMGLIGLMIVASTVMMLFNRPRQVEQVQQDYPLYGDYEVLSFQPTWSSQRKEWEGLKIGSHGTSELETVDGSTHMLSVNPDTVSNQMTIYAYGDSLMESVLEYRQTSDSLLSVNGDFNGDSILVVLKLKKQQGHLLTTRGFHWINEMPFHR